MTKLRFTLGQRLDALLEQIGALDGARVQLAPTQGYFIEDPLGNIIIYAPAEGGDTHSARELAQGIVDAVDAMLEAEDITSAATVGELKTAFWETEDGESLHIALVGLLDAIARLSRSAEIKDYAGVVRVALDDAGAPTAI